MEENKKNPMTGTHTQTDASKQEMVEQMEKEVAANRREVARLHEQIESSRISMSDQRNNIKNTQDLINKQKREIKNFKIDLQSGHNQKEIDGLKLSTLTLVASKQEKELKELEREYGAQKDASLKIKATIEDYEEKNRVTKHALEMRAEELAEIKKAYAVKSKRVVETAQEHRELTESLGKLKVSIDEAQEKLESEVKQLTVLEGLVEAQKEDMRIASSKLEEVYFQVVAHQKKRDGLVNKKRANEQSIATFESEYEKAKAELDGINNRILEVESEIVKQEAVMRTKATSSENLRSDLSSKYKELSEKGYMAEVNHAKIEELEKAIERNRSDFDSKKLECSKLEAQLKNQTTKLADLQRTCIEFEEKLSGITSNVENFARDISTTERQIQTQEVRGHELKEAIIATSVRLKEATEKLNVLVAQKDHLLQENAGFEKRIAAMVEECDVKEAKIAQLRQENEKLAVAGEDLRFDVTAWEQKVSERKKLIAEQQSLYDGLKTTETELANQVAGLNEQVEEQKIVIEKFESAIGVMNTNLAETTSRYNGVRELLTITFGKSNSMDESVRKMLEEAQSYNVGMQKFDQVMGAHLATLKGDLTKKKEIFTEVHETARRLAANIQDQYQEMGRLQNELNSKRFIVEEKQKEIDLLAKKLEEGNRRRPILENDYFAVNGKIQEFEEAIGNNRLALDEMARSERALMDKIEVKKHEMHVQQAELEKLEAQKAAMMTKIDDYNSELEILQNEVHGNGRIINEQKSSALELTRDIEELEQHIKEYQAKVEVQEKQIRESSSMVAQLTMKNKNYLAKLEKLEQIVNKNETVLAEAKREEENLERQLKATYATYKETLGKNMSMLSHIPQGAVHDLVKAEEDLRVGLLTKINSVKRKLETKFFNSTFDIIELDFKDEFKYSDEQLDIFEGVQESILNSIVSNLSAQAEVYGEIQADGDKMKTTLSVSRLGSVGHEVAKEILVPATKKLLAQYNANGLSIGFKLKVHPGGMIEKLGITITMPMEVNEATNKAPDSSAA